MQLIRDTAGSTVTALQFAEDCFIRAGLPSSAATSVGRAQHNKDDASTDFFVMCVYTPAHPFHNKIVSYKICFNMKTYFCTLSQTNNVIEQQPLPLLLTVFWEVCQWGSELTCVSCVTGQQYQGYYLWQIVVVLLFFEIGGKETSINVCTCSPFPAA